VSLQTSGVVAARRYLGTITAQTGLLRILHLMHPEAEKKNENSDYGPKILQISPQVLTDL